MKKIYVLFAITSLFVLQLCYVRPIYAVNDGNIDLDSDKYNNVESANSITYSCGSRMVKDIPSSACLYGSLAIEFNTANAP